MIEGVDTLLRKCRIYQPAKGIWHIHYPNQYLLAASWMRIQEFYESGSTKLKGQHFTTDDLMDYYASVSNWKFNYLTDWAGFNTPSEEIQNFYRKFKKNLSYKEKYLFSILRKIIPNWLNKRYCIIGTYKIRGYYNHEFAHALYNMNEEYKDQMDILVDSCAVKTHMANRLISTGYHPSVIYDEHQAYFATSSDQYLKSDWGIQNPFKVSSPFKSLFRKYKIKHSDSKRIK